MKAIQALRYGSPDVLELVDLPIPTPGEGQALVRILASSVNAMDWHSVRGEPRFARLMLGLRRPKSGVAGADLAGVVEAVGPDVTSVKPGDEVLGMSIKTWAEHAVVKAEGLVPKPAGASWEQAGAIGVAALTALQGLRDKGRVGPGQRVLIAGAGGGVGHYAVQIAKALGAEVTATTAPSHLEMVRSLGPDEVLDYTTVDATAQAGRFDVVFDAGGYLSLRQVRRALRPGGRAVIAGAGAKSSLVGFIGGMVAARVLSRLDSRRYISFVAHRTQDDLQALRAMLEAGQLHPVIDRRYPLADAREALRYAETGTVGGKVAITVGDAPRT